SGLDSDFGHMKLSFLVALFQRLQGLFLVPKSNVDDCETARCCVSLRWIVRLARKFEQLFPITLRSLGRECVAHGSFEVQYLVGIFPKKNSCARLFSNCFVVLATIRVHVREPLVLDGKAWKHFRRFLQLT